MRMPRLPRLSRLTAPALTVGAALIIGTVGGYAYAASTASATVVTHTNTVTVPGPVDSGTLSVSWTEVDQHPTAGDVARCGTWVPAIAYTRQAGMLVSDAICAPADGDPVAANDAYVSGLVGR